MIFLSIVILLVAYSMAASWAVSHGGLHRLWLMGSATLLLIAVAAVPRGMYYGVPSLARWLLYAMTFTGPAVIVPTVLLSFSKAPGTTWAGRLPVAVIGVCIGILCGWVLAVFGMGRW
ncbi:MAG TPA: hypothetical protein VJ386_09770 [Candidatus Deferrimicrobiaceae bacterium]|jgi:hypothetical protein|nr:hypothetical protein [Candidatus Deferrimicrobiaceae bacterium]